MSQKRSRLSFRKAIGPTPASPLCSGAANFEAPSLAYTPVWLMILAILFATLDVISGVYPALRATRLDPIAALRYE